jgi:hypothetical protein
MNDVEFVKLLAQHHRQNLLDQTHKINDGGFSSGASWAVHALDRIIMACDGERDPEVLGLIPKAPPPPPVQEPLFGVDHA